MTLLRSIKYFLLYDNVTYRRLIHLSTVSCVRLWTEGYELRPAAFLANGCPSILNKEPHEAAVIVREGGIPYGDGPLLIGGKYRSLELYTNAIIDDVRIYGRALSTTEVGQLFHEAEH